MFVLSHISSTVTVESDLGWELQLIRKGSLQLEPCVFRKFRPKWLGVERVPITVKTRYQNASDTVGPHVKSSSYCMYRQVATLSIKVGSMQIS